MPECTKLEDLDDTKSYIAQKGQTVFCSVRSKTAHPGGGFTAKHYLDIPTKYLPYNAKFGISTLYRFLYIPLDAQDRWLNIACYMIQPESTYARIHSECEEQSGSYSPVCFVGFWML